MVRWVDRSWLLGLWWLAGCSGPAPDASANATDPEPASTSSGGGGPEAGDGSTTEASADTGTTDSTGRGSTGSESSSGSESSTGAGAPSACYEPPTPFEVLIEGLQPDSRGEWPREVYYNETCTLDAVQVGGTPEQPSTDVSLWCPPSPGEDEVGGSTSDGGSTGGDEQLVHLTVQGLAIEIPGELVELRYRWEFPFDHTSGDDFFFYFSVSQPDGRVVLVDATNTTLHMQQLGTSAPVQREQRTCDHFSNLECAYQVGFAGVNEAGAFELFDGSAVEHQHEGETFLAHGHGLRAEDCEDPTFGPLYYRSTFVRADLIVE